MLQAQHFAINCLLLIHVACSALAQTNGGLIKRTPESAEQTRQAERRVTIDIQVSDASGKAVSGLQQQDLAILDNGRPQVVTSFREVGGTNELAPTEAILLLDTMNATFQDVVIEREGIDKFLRQNGGRLELPVSIVFLADTGVKILKASQDGVSLAEDLKKVPTPMRVIGSAQGAEGAQDRSQRSLRAAQMLATYESTRAGRKLLIWVGPGWPLLSRSTAALSAQDQKAYFGSIVDLTTALRRAQVTLYSVAPLNLAQVSGQNAFLYEAYLKGVETPAQADSPNLALQVLAIHSGGLVLMKNGDLVGQIAVCMADARDYYEVSFDAPEDEQIHYRALQIKLDRPDATARSSTEYYTGVPESTAALPARAAATSPSTTGPAGTARALSTEARLLVEDMTVADKSGQPIKGLSAADFLLLEDNAPQKILSVAEHSAVQEIAAAPNHETQTAMVVTNGTTIVSNRPPAGDDWNVLLIDLFNTPNDARGRLQNQVEQFLQQLPEHQPMALVIMSNQIKVETSFQDGAGSALRYLRKNGLGRLDASTPADMTGRQDVLMPSADLAGTAIPHQANADVEVQASRAQKSMDNFSALARWLAPFPGRKNVYWVSGGFPLQGQPFGVKGYSLNSPGLGPDVKGNSPVPMQQRTDKELEKARIAIYPVDARGVAAPDAGGVTTADSTFTASVAIVTAKDNDLSAAQRSEMLEIAKATGGIAQFSNNIAQALRDDFNQANTYYTVTYTPPDKEWKGAYHRIEIAVDRPDAQLTYRRGYYAQDEVTAKPTLEQFQDALRLGAPAGQAVQFTSQITRSGKDTIVECSVEPKTVDFQEDASGQLLTDIDFAVLEYDAKGKVLGRSAIKLSGKMTPGQRAHLTAKTLTAKQTIELKHGTTNLVIGVLDRVSGRFGNAEVGVENAR